MLSIDEWVKDFNKSYNAETKEEVSEPTVVSEDQEIDAEDMSGATGFEEDPLALKRATNNLTPFQQFGDFVSGVTSKENLEKAFLRSAESERRIGEKAGRIALSAGVGITQTPLELVELVGNVVAPERVAKIKESKLGQAYGNIIEAIDPLAIQEEQVDEAISTDPIGFKLTDTFRS